MAYTDLRWTGSPVALTAALADLGHPDFAAAGAARDARVRAFGPVGMLTVAGRAVMFALVRLEEGATLPTPAGLFLEPGALSESVTGVFMEVPVAVTYKSDVWLRCSDEEAAVLTAALGPDGMGTPRLRGLWADCLSLQHDAPFFAFLLAQMTGAFGAGRAAELLAPSTYL